MAAYNDPLFTLQWHLLQIGLDKLGAEYTGCNVRVGIFDDGVQEDHPDLACNYNASLHVAVSGALVDPGAGAHGTAVAGLIAAAANGTGGVGVASGAMIAGVNIFSGAAAEDLVGSLRQMSRFDVVNNSWGSTGCY